MNIGNTQNSYHFGHLTEAETADIVKWIVANRAYIRYVTAKVQTRDYFKYLEWEPAEEDMPPKPSDEYEVADIVIRPHKKNKKLNEFLMRGKLRWGC